MFNEPEQDENELELYLPEVGRAVDKWLAYKFNSHFLTPTDGFSLEVAAASLDPVFETGLVTGARVQLRVGGCTQATGFIDSIERSASRDGGTIWAIEGRDLLGQAVDAGVDPRWQFKETENLSDLLKRIYEPYGWSEDSQFIVDASADQQIKTGRPAKKRPSLAKHPRKSKLPQLRPNPNEGAHEFASRVAKRFGLTIWPSADGQTLIVGKPYFEQEPTFRLIRRRFASRENNILSGSARYDLSDQPSVIIADGTSGGGTFGKSRIKCIAVNPAVWSDQDALAKIAAEHKTAKQLLFLTQDGAPMAFTPQRNPRAKPLYLHDENSKTIEQLEEFTRREMMARVCKSMTWRGTVAGHGQYDGGGNMVPWAVDTVVDMQDEVAGVTEPMWVLSRTFSKSRSGGTTTELELIRLYSLEL